MAKSYKMELSNHQICVSKAQVEGKVLDLILQDLEGTKPALGKFSASQAQT